MIDQETKACLLEMLAVCKGMGRIKDGKTMWEGSPIKDPECCELWERLNDVLHTANRLAGGEQWGASDTVGVKALVSANCSTDSSEAEINRLKEINHIYWKALTDIKNWTDTMEHKWGDLGYRAQHALKKANP